MHVVPITCTGSSATSLATVYVSPSKETTHFRLVPNMPAEGTKDTTCKSCFEASGKNLGKASSLLHSISAIARVLCACSAPSSRSGCIPKITQGCAHFAEITNKPAEDSLANKKNS